MKRILPLLIVILAIALIWVLFFWQPEQQSEHGVLFAPVEQPQGGDFTLTSNKGKVSLHDFQGKVVLLYFGYTWCPDICPTSLSLMAAGLSRLEEDELAQVQPIFVSVDPARDTVERLETYSKYFHDAIIGVTGSATEIAAVVKQYGAAYRKVDQESATEYVVDHTSETYVIDRRGRLVEALPHGTMPSDIVKAVRGQLAQ